MQFHSNGEALCMVLHLLVICISSGDSVIAISAVEKVRCDALYTLKVYTLKVYTLKVYTLSGVYAIRFIRYHPFQPVYVIRVYVIRSRPNYWNKIHFDNPFIYINFVAHKFLINTNEINIQITDIYINGRHRTKLNK